MPEFFSLVNEVNNEIEKIDGGTTGKTTTGGMKTKIESVKKASLFGVPSVIANGEKENSISRIFAGEDLVHSYFLPRINSKQGNTGSPII